MQEDEIGLRKEFGQADYVQCSRCSMAIARSQATVVTADVLTENAAYEYLCPTCRDEIAAGEQDLPLAPE